MAPPPRPVYFGCPRCPGEAQGAEEQARQGVARTVMGHGGRIFEARIRPSTTRADPEEDDGGTSAHRHIGTSASASLMVATASEDGTAKVWAGSEFGVVHDLVSHDEEVLDVEWSESGNMLATASADRKVTGTDSRFACMHEWYSRSRQPR